MPDYERRQREIRALKQELAALLLEQHELEFHARTSIEAEYMAKIGSLEYKALELRCKAIRLRRKYELIAEAVNSLELVELSRIDAQLIRELSAHNEKLSEFMGRMNAALARRGAMSGEDAAELRRLYAALLKKLHPDLNPLRNETTKALFSRALGAYRNAALGELREVYAAAEGLKELMDAPVGSMDRLLKTEERLQEQIGVLRESIGELKNSYPCNTQDLLDDEAKLREKTAALIGRIAEFRKTCDDLEKRIAALLGRSVWTA
jgi:DnaJ-domain-containing protein 1